MKGTRTEILVLLLLLTGCFALGTLLDPKVSAWRGSPHADSVVKVLLGDGRRLFSNHFFTQADVAFHGGYYPSIFDKTQGPKDTAHLNGRDGEPEAGHSCADACDHEEHEPADHDPDHCKDHDHGEAHEPGDEHDAHEKAMAFLGPPRDWIEAFGRRFMITEHTHLESGQEKEMLPWLRIAAELDPQNVQSYTVAAYWLRSMGRIQEAEQFLREGQRNNPDSYEILFELGRFWLDHHQDSFRARNLWELAVAKWVAQNAGQKEPDLVAYSQLTLRLARLEEDQTNYSRAIDWLELAKKGSPNPVVLDTQISELREKLTLAQPGDKSAATRPTVP